MKKRLHVILLLFFSLHLAKAQEQETNLKWGKVSAEEIALNECTFDSSASAVILFDVGEINFRGGVANIFRHRRIKILDRKGLDYADVKIPYYKYKNVENIHSLKAQTLKVDAQGKVQKMELSNKDIFDNQLDERWGEQSFSFPAVEEGTIIEYKYTLSTKDIYFLEAWVFQNELPTRHSQLKVEIPSSLTYRYLMHGANLLKKYRGNVDSNNSWILNNIPGYKNEDFVFNYLDYTDKIQFQLENYKTSGIENGGGIETVSVLQTWPEVVADLNDMHKFFLRKNKLTEQLLANIILPKDNDKEKAQKIFYWVQQQVAWNGYYSYLHSQQGKDLLSTKKGNSAEINLLLINLLRGAGLAADPVLISTRRHGKVYKGHAFINQFNHLIVQLKLKEKVILLDAATSLDGQAYDVMPIMNLNETGLVLEEEEEPVWIDIKPNNSSSTCFVELNLSEPNAEFCKVSFKFSGHIGNEKKISFRKSPNAILTPEELSFSNVGFSYKEKLEEQSETDNAALSLSYLYEPGSSLLGEDFIYINPMILHRFRENPFPREEHG